MVNFWLIWFKLMWFSANPFFYQSKKKTWKRKRSEVKKNTFKREEDERIESFKVCNQLPSTFRVCDLIHDKWRPEIQWNIRFKIKVKNTSRTTARTLINIEKIGQCFKFESQQSIYKNNWSKICPLWQKKNIRKYILWRIIASSKLLFTSKNVRLRFTRMEQDETTILK